MDAIICKAQRCTRLLTGDLPTRRRRNSDGRRSLPLQLLAHIALMILVAGHSLAADSLRNGGVIKDGETLVSQGQVFELGFFSPGGSTRRYVGIWYKNIPVQTVVWVANRESPFSDATGMLTVDSAGSLVLLNGRGSPIVLASSPAEESAVALLRDDGNFVLAAASNRSRVFWQSFDHPTDTFLPGMRLGLRGRQNLLLTSWRDPEDPSPGDFELGLDPGGTAQLLMWQRGYNNWASGPWNGIGFSFLPEMRFCPYSHYTYAINGKESYFTYSANTSILAKFVMGYDGQFQKMVWLDSTQAWAIFLSYPRGGLCEYPAACGGNGVCVNSGGKATCRCLGGFFAPKWSWQQHSSYWSGGCERTRPLRCGEDDGFLRLHRVKLPVMFLGSRAIRSPTLNISDCSALCSKNCSCTAYASANTEGRGCLLWSGDLVGLQENVDGVQDLYVRLAASALDDERGVSNKKKPPLLLLIIPAILSGAIVACCVIRCRRSRRRKSKHKVREETNQELLFLEICRSGGKNYEHFSLHSFEKIAAATENFSDENKLGEGGFGPVYKGTLSEGQEIAVKRLSKRSGQGMEEFKTEILLIAKLQHRNLVRLLGCCIKGEERMLVYEYMPNKSLDYFLFDSARAAQLDWGRRLHIIDGIAQGLLYLHKHSRMRIIHRDLKASNILLDKDMNPKISDFGMARISSPNDAEANTRRVVGTYGYMSPEYAMAGLFSVKSDVFSFGVLLLEIVSGKRNTAACQFTNSINLLGYAWTLWKEGRGMELMDATLCGSCVEAEFSRCVRVALLCIQEAAADRPTTSEIVVMLGNEHASLPTPKQPAFFTGSETTDGDTPYPDLPMNNSLNHVTISVMDGR